MVDLSNLNIISFALIFLVGLPHGSFDGAVAVLVGFNTKLEFIKFIFFYLVLFFVVVVFWLYFPIISLLIFLSFTILHFGLCDWSFYKTNKYKKFISLTHGLAVIFGIIYFNEAESLEIFSYLSNDKIYFFQKYLIFFYILTLVLIIIFALLSITEKYLRFGVVEILFLLSVFYFFDPLFSFAIYFCFFHTYKHLKHLIININLFLKDKKFVLYTTLLFTIISWIGGGVVTIFLLDSFSYYETFIKVCFIGLAALTLPHMILVDVVYRHKFKKN